MLIEIVKVDNWTLPALVDMDDTAPTVKVAMYSGVPTGFPVRIFVDGASDFHFHRYSYDCMTNTFAVECYHICFDSCLSFVSVVFDHLLVVERAVKEQEDKFDQPLCFFHTTLCQRRHLVLAIFGYHCRAGTSTCIVCHNIWHA